MSTLDLIRGGTPAPRTYDTGLGECRAVTVLPDEPVAVLAGSDVLMTLDLTTGRVERYDFDDETYLRAVAGLTDRRVLAVGFHEVFLCRLRDGDLEILASWPIESDSSVLDVAATVTGSRFAIAVGNEAYVGDIGRKSLTIVKSSPCLAVGVSPDGATVAIGYGQTIELLTGAPPVRGGRVRLDDADVQIFSWNNKEVPYLSIGLSPDGRRIAAGDDMGRTFVFDVDAGAVRKLDNWSKTIGARWSDDGSAVALIMLSRVVGLHDPSGEQVATLEANDDGQGYFVGGGWTPDQRGFVVGDEEGRVLAWTFASALDSTDS